MQCTQSGTIKAVHSKLYLYNGTIYKERNIDSKTYNLQCSHVAIMYVCRLIVDNHQSHTKCINIQLQATQI